MLVGTNVNGVRRLFRFTPGQSDSMEVVGARSYPGYAAWSPDRTRIAFVQADTALMLANPDGSGAVALVQTGQWRLSKFAWAPDGQRIAFDGFSRSGAQDAILAVVTVATGAVREVLRGGPAFAREPDWSPDGRRLLYSAGPTGRRQLHVMNADGTAARQLTEDPNYEGWGQWSPNGAHIVFVSTRNGPFELWLADADGRRPRRLVADGTDANDYAPSWSPDGRSLAFMRTARFSSSVMTVSVDGGTPREAGFSGFVSFVSW
jgi:TolB protein